MRLVYSFLPIALSTIVFSLVSAPQAPGQITSFSGWADTQTPGATGGTVDENCGTWSNVAGPQDPIFGFPRRLQASSEVTDPLVGGSFASWSATAIGTIKVGPLPAILKIDGALRNGKLNLDGLSGTVSVIGTIAVQTLAGVPIGSTAAGPITRTTVGTTSPVNAAAPTKMLCLAPNKIYAVVAILDTSASISGSIPLFHQAESDFKNIDAGGYPGFEITLTNCGVSTLSADTNVMSVSAASTQNLILCAGKANALKNYWVFTGFAASGDIPGVTFAPGVVLPLNQPDPLTGIVASLTQLGGGAPTFVGWKGLLNVDGEASASMNIIGPVPVPIGVTIRHAALVYTSNGCGFGCDTFQLATNWVPMTTVP